MHAEKLFVFVHDFSSSLKFYSFFFIFFVIFDFCFLIPLISPNMSMFLHGIPRAQLYKTIYFHHPTRQTHCLFPSYINVSPSMG